MRVDHGVAPDSQGNSASILRGVDRTRIKGNMSFNRLLRQRCHPRRNLPVNRYVGDPYFLYRCNECPCLACVAVEEAFARQCLDVLHHRCLAREAEMMLDFPRAWRHPFFTLLRLDEFQNASLSFREHALSSLRMESVQVQMNTDASSPSAESR